MRRAAGILVAMMLGMGSEVFAQAPSADALFEQGRAALARGDLEIACSKFAVSDRLDPAAGTRANLGQCEEKRGRLPPAWRAYRAALELLPRTDPRAAAIRARITAIEPQLSWLTLELDSAAPRETTVREGAKKIGPYGTAFPVDLGVHELVFEAPGREPRTVRTTFSKGEKTTIIVRFPEESEDSPALPASASASNGAAPAPRGKDVILVRVLGDDPAVTLLGPGGAPLCRTPCERWIPRRPGQEFSIGGDGITTSGSFPLDTGTTIRARAGSSARRAGGIALLVAGGVATLAGAALIGAGASVVQTDQLGRDLGRTVYPPAIAGGVAAALVGVGLVVGGVVLVRQSKTDVTTAAGPWRVVW